MASPVNAHPAGPLIDALDLTDRMYVGYFLLQGAAILAQRERLPHWEVFIAIHAAALGTISMLVIMRRRNRVWRFLHDWYPVAMPILTFEEVARLSFLFANHWQDLHILEFEQRIFGVHPTVWIQQFASPFLTEVLQVGYFSYFVLLMIVAGVLYRRADRQPFYAVMAASVLSYLLCYVFFLAFPTEGPAYTLREWHTVELDGWFFHWAVGLIQSQAGVHGNAFPSAHVAGAVAALLYGWRYAPRLGAWLTPLVILLCLGAVYDRYHYVSDVVAGIPIGAITALILFQVEARLGLRNRLRLVPDA